MAQCLMASRKDMKRFESKKASLPDVPRFFKPIFGEGYSEFLYLPPKIAQTMEHMADEETHLQDSSGRTWPMTISYVNGLLAFHKGWDEFFLQHGLSIGQILLFEHIKGTPHFSVRIYGTDACEMLDFMSSQTENGEGKDEENVNACTVVFPSYNKVGNSSPANEAEILFPEILQPLI